MYFYGFRRIGRCRRRAPPAIKSDIPDPLFAFITVGMFLLTVLAMAFREVFGVKLGFIALTGAIILVLIIEILGDKLKEAPSFEHIVQELDWRAVFFYIALFALVGGLEKTHILDMMANAMKPLFATNYALGATLLYWVTIPIVGLVEHDAYILTFLYMIKDLGAQGVPTWPLWWMVLWSGTLGSNLTVAGAPALYVALRIAEKEEDRKVSLKGVPVLESGVLPGQRVLLLHLRDADLGPALRELRSRRMFKNILIPTDGSAQAQKAVVLGVGLAKAVGAKVTGFFAAPPATPIVYRHHLPVGFAQPAEHEQTDREDGRRVSRLHRAARQTTRACRSRGRTRRTTIRPTPFSRSPQERLRSDRDGDAWRRRPARRAHRQRRAESAPSGQNTGDGRSLGRVVIKRLSK